MKRFSILILIYNFIIATSFGIKNRRENPIRILENTDELYNNTNINIFEPSEKKQSSKPLLLGFTTIKSKEKENNKDKKDIAVINLFFKNVADKSIFKKYIYFTVTIPKKSRRRLKDEAIALRGTLNETTLNEGQVQYIVKGEEGGIPENTESFDLNKNIMFEETKLEPENIKEELDNLGSSVSDVQYSQEFKTNSDQNDYEPEKYKIFKAEEINKYYNKKIQIIGKLLDNYVPSKRINEQLTFKCVHCYPANSLFEAILEKYNETCYSLTSDLSNIVIINLQDAIANLTLKSDNLRFMIENEYEKLLLSEAKDDLLDIEFSSIPISAKTLKKTSSGLSAGGIVLIVIACIVALATVVLIFIFCVKPKKVKEYSRAIDLYNSTATLNSE